MTTAETFDPDRDLTDGLTGGVVLGAMKLLDEIVNDFMESLDGGADPADAEVLEEVHDKSLYMARLFNGVADHVAGICNGIYITHPFSEISS